MTASGAALCATNGRGQRRQFHSLLCCIICLARAACSCTIQKVDAPGAKCQPACCGDNLAPPVVGGQSFQRRPCVAPPCILSFELINGRGYRAEKRHRRATARPFECGPTKQIDDIAASAGASGCYWQRPRNSSHRTAKPFAHSTNEAERLSTAPITASGQTLLTKRTTI